MYAPVWFDVCDGSDVVLSGEHELVVQNPLRFVIQTRGRMELDDLVVLHRQVVSRPL